VLAWGANDYGQLGDGTTGNGAILNRTSPVVVLGLTGVVAVAAGNLHTVALKSDCAVMAWGDNYWGSLGDGTTTTRSSPVAVTNGFNLCASPTVPKTDQAIGAINFSPTTLALGDTTLVSATANSGLAVSFSSATPGICSVSGSTVTGIAVGACIIAADQAGNASYNAASQMTQSIPVTTGSIVYSLTANITGSGSINNVQQNSPAFVCSSPSTNCSVSSSSGTSFALYAIPSMLFDFAGWSGGGCSSDPCQLALNGNTTVTATFTPQLLLQRVGSATPYMSFSSAYSDASNGSEIRARDAIINGDVHLNRDMSVTLKGGYADGFTTINGFTTIQGKLSINQGSVRVSNIKTGSPAVANFTLAPPAAATAVQGGSGTSTINTTVEGGFNAAVAMTASGLPTGATFAFSPTTISAPGSGSTTLTLSTGASTPTGVYSITVTGMGGGKTHITTMSFTVTDGGNITATLLSDGFEAGGWLTSQISGTEGLWTMVGTGVNPVALPHGGAKMVNFNSYTAADGSQTRLYRSSGIAIPGTITSATLSFWMYHDTGWGALNDYVQLQVSTNGSSWTDIGTPVNRYDGTTGWAQVSIDVSAYKGQTLWPGFVGMSVWGNDIYLDDVEIISQGTAAADFTITAPTTATAVQGGSGTATIITTGTGGFNAGVALTATGVPTGATYTFSPTTIAAPGSGSSTLTITAGATTPAGTYSVTVTGTGSGRTHIATISFTVATPPVASFAGTYTGTYSGGDNGTITVNLATNGSISGSGSSNLDSSVIFPITGNVAAGGAVSLTGGGTAGTAIFTGTVTSSGVLSGLWSDSDSGLSGTFTTHLTQISPSSAVFDFFSTDIIGSVACSSAERATSAIITLTSAPDWDAGTLNGTAGIEYSDGNPVSFNFSTMTGTLLRGGKSYAYRFYEKSFTAGRILYLDITDPLITDCHREAMILRNNSRPNMLPIPSAKIEVAIGLFYGQPDTYHFTSGFNGDAPWILDGGFSADPDGRIVSLTWNSSKANRTVTYNNIYQIVGQVIGFDESVYPDEQVTITLTAIDDEGAKSVWTDVINPSVSSGSLTLSTPFQGVSALNFDPPYFTPIDNSQTYNSLDWYESTDPTTHFILSETLSPYSITLYIDYKDGYSYNGGSWVSVAICSDVASCANSGITFDKTIGTLTLLNVDLQGIGSTPSNSFSGTLHFTPY